MLGGRAEVPEDRLAAAGQQREPDQLVHRPGADVGRGHVADVGEVEGQQGAERGALERGAEPGQPVVAEPVEVDALLPVDGVGPVRADHRRTAHGLCVDSPSKPPSRGKCQVLLHTVYRHTAHVRVDVGRPSDGSRPNDDDSADPVRERARRRRPGGACGPGLSLRELASRVAVSPSFITQIERGKANPSVGTLYALVTELGASLDELMVTRSEVCHARASWPTQPGLAADRRAGPGRRGTGPGRDVRGGLGAADHDHDPFVDFLHVEYHRAARRAHPRS